MPRRTPARFGIATISIVIALGLAVGSAQARPTIRTSFFNVYPAAVGSRLDNLPSSPGHCGVCHYAFTGAGLKNPYGVRIGNLLGSYSNNDAGRQALMRFIENEDSDSDGTSNRIEVTDLANYGNTPTFPGLTAGNIGSISAVSVGEVLPHVTPTTAVDTTPPAIAVIAPNGGETIAANTTVNVQYTASDVSGVPAVSIDMSDDGGVTWKPVARDIPNAGSYAWFVPNRPGAATRIRVKATDGAGNPGQDASAGSFTVTRAGNGRVPTTLRDLDLAGTQPLAGATLADPNVSCRTCHGDYEPANEPWATWRGSMMAQAMRDPLFLACLAVAEQDAPSVGDLCLRCHTPGGWQEGRSIDTSGGMLTAKDREGIQCDFCHRAVDPVYTAGVNPPQDLSVLAGVSPLPLQYGNGQFISDPGADKRGPFSDPLAAGHNSLYSPFHTSSNLCGTCHDVSNPVFVETAPGKYTPNGFDAAHPDQNLRNMKPVERTFSEWQASAFAQGPVALPNYPEAVSSCQDCHMRNVTAAGSNQPGSPVRSNLPLHDLTGGNTFVLDILPDFYPGEVDVDELQAAKVRAVAMLQKAATLEMTPNYAGVTVRVVNQTAHKLISGYPEGRRMWLNLQAYDAAENLIFESGHYDPATGDLAHDEQAAIYHIEGGLTPGLAAALGLPAGPSFHFVLNDTTYLDNRIPPRGFTNAAFEAIQSPPVGYAYADGQYWDDRAYTLPNTARTVHARLYYQATSREYVEFLRDENTTNTIGQELYDAWVDHGRSTPVLMAEATVNVDVTSNTPQEPRFSLALGEPSPNPFTSRSMIRYALPAAQAVQVTVYDIRGHRVRVLLDDVMPAGAHETAWDGRDAQGGQLASGTYFVRLQSGGRVLTRRLSLVH
jgi:hypothetical protein